VTASQPVSTSHRMLVYADTHDAIKRAAPGGRRAVDPCSRTAKLVLDGPGPKVGPWRGMCYLSPEPSMRPAACVALDRVSRRIARC